MKLFGRATMMMICSLTNKKEDVMAMSHEDGATRLGYEEFKEMSKTHLMRTPLYLMCDSIDLELLPNTQHIKCIHHQIVGLHKEKCIAYL
jgi:hypothetical protein